MKTYDSGYQGKKKRVSKKGAGGSDFVRRMMASLGEEKINRMWDNHRARIQAKMEISQPQDAAEIQADKVAEGVVQGDTKISHSALTQNPVSEINAKSEGGSMQTSDAFDSQLQGTKGQGQKLDTSTKTELEQHTGTDLSGVNIHTNSKAGELSESINAKAFTHGQDIYFKEGQYNPESKDGKQLLAHEVAHTVQQGGGKVQPKIQRQGDNKKPKSRIVKLVCEELKKEKSKINKAKILAWINDFSISDIHDYFEEVMKLLNKKVDTSTYLDAYIIFQNNYWGENKKGVTERSKWQENNLEEVKQVKSKTIVDAYDKQIPQLLKNVRDAMSTRDKNLEAVSEWKEVTGNDLVKTAVNSSKERWKDLKKILRNPAIDPITVELPSDLYVEIASEEDAINVIPGKSKKDRLYYTRSSMKSFLNALEKYTETRKEKLIETEQFHRFDELFTQPKMYKILGKQKVITPADIKALTARESGDFAMIEVAGVGKDKPGYKNKLKPIYPKLYTGIGQLGAEAKKEGIDEVKKFGVDIPDKIDGTDTRDIPEYAVLISTGYLLHMYDGLKKEFAGRLPTDNLELKKLIFAAYNWTVAKFKSAVKNNLKEGDIITFESIKKHLPDETQKYVEAIFYRLGLEL